MRSCPVSRIVSATACALWLLTLAGPAQAVDPAQVKRDAITTLSAHMRTVNLGGIDRTGYDPYATAFDGELKIQTEATAMALYFAGVENLGLSASQLQAIYDYFEYMLAGDGWLYSDYTAGPTREFRKGLHNAWALIAIDILEQNGISDSANIKTQVRDTLEAAIDSNGYMAFDPDGNSLNLRTKFVQSLPFFFKIAQDTGDAGAIAKARLSIDFYMANCIDANYDVWHIDASGTKLALITSHEAAEFAHGLYLFHEYETDATRKTAIQANLTGILNRYESGTWSFTNSFAEKYLSSAASAGTVNTLSTFQIQFLLEFAARKGWITSGLAGAYLDIVDTIKITGTGDPELDNNFYYLADPDTGAQISANINSYNGSYVIHAIDVQYKTISGTILDSGTPVAGVLVSADGGGGSHTTDSSGNYALLVPHGWSGSVTPTKAEYGFVPSTRVYVNLTADDPDEDYTGSYTPDLTAPSPDPLTWAAVPVATASTRISMTATTASDSASPPVEYFFDCTSDPSASSGWQASPTYEATGLSSATLYSFRVKTRDGALALNETGWSSSASATTPAPPPTTLYDFTGIGAPSAGHLAEDGEIDVADSVIENGTFAGRRDFGSGWALWNEASSGEYANLVGSDDNRYRGADPSSGDNAAMLFTLYVNENPLDVTQIDVSVELGRNASLDLGWVYIWNYTSSSYLVLGSQSGTADQVVAATLSNNAGNYVEPATGEVTIFVVNEDTSDWIRVDEISLTIHAGASSVCGNNILETGEDCDDGNTSNGDCCSASCSFESAATVCRSSADVCDVAETCTGVGASCPTDQVLDGVPCLDGDVCNGAEQCVIGVCESGAILDCDDGDVCTADSCDAIDGCGHALIEGCSVDVPTSSEWSLTVMILLMTAAGGLLIEQARRRSEI
jgi:cysteine-rich repeat protein